MTNYAQVDKGKGEAIGQFQRQCSLLLFQFDPLHNN